MPAIRYRDAASSWSPVRSATPNRRRPPPPRPPTPGISGWGDGAVQARENLFPKLHETQFALDQIGHHHHQAFAVRERAEIGRTLEPGRQLLHSHGLSLIH